MHVFQPTFFFFILKQWFEIHACFHEFQKVPASLEIKETNDINEIDEID